MITTGHNNTPYTYLKLKPVKVKGGDGTTEILVLSNSFARGGYGSVALGRNEQGHVFAIKKHTLQTQDDKPAKTFLTCAEDVLLEIQNTKAFQPKLIAGEPIYYSSKKGKNKIITKHPLMLGDLNDMACIVDETFRNILNEGDHHHTVRKLARSMFIHIAVQLREMHKHGYIHGDVKPANMLASQTGNILLSDFGNVWPIGEPMKRLSTFMPPQSEIPAHATTQIDVFALGVSFLLFCQGGGNIDTKNNNRFDRAKRHATSIDPILGTYVANQILNPERQNSPSIDDAIYFTEINNLKPIPKTLLANTFRYIFRNKIANIEAISSAMRTVMFEVRGQQPPPTPSNEMSNVNRPKTFDANTPRPGSAIAEPL